MFLCHVCDSTRAQEELVNEVFEIEGKWVLVEQIPAQVSRRCGEAVFSRAATEKVRRLVHSAGRPPSNRFNWMYLLLPGSRVSILKYQKI